MNNQDAIGEMQETMTVTTLEQARLLADPFKLELLEAFSKQASTIKRVASDLGEKPTRLYRHVDALEKAGLLSVVSERQKRGTIERTFRTVARRFVADPMLFHQSADGSGQEPVRRQFQTAADDLVAALSHAENPHTAIRPICLRVLSRASPERLKLLHQLLLDWIELAAAEPDEEEQDLTASALIVFHQNKSTAG